ncbi:MAG TPA: SDR family NAD(P)-dependent oxidoreductase [Solirubrobacteraceae bacterium]|nr:SDR family NAD(P)-dependent oxidoreductase [Solirubrobacteraceae bacterium]
MPAVRSFPLSGSTALVTGATGGIGHAIARALHAHGARLILSGRRQGELERIAGELGATAISADLADGDDVARLGSAGVAAGVDVLVANAALPASGLLLELAAEDVDRMLEVNLRAPIALAHSLAPAMVARGRGHMVFISSLSGKAANPASSLYSATKFGLRGFALGLREDLRSRGVGVSVVAPGFIRDAGMFADTGLRLPPGVGTRSPEEVAEAVVAAIRRNRAEVDVAPPGLRLGAAFASVAPGAAAWGARLLGSHRIATEMAERQRGAR